ncbi:MAG TPA: ABC transporter permease subunit [Pirellulales bacterium]|jgi:ABC-2 type transport system permease protein
MTNKALWIKCFRDMRVLLFFLTCLLFGFNWLFVYITSLIDLAALKLFLGSLPPFFEQLVGMSFDSVATCLGRISMAYVDPVVVFSTTIWAIGRGSDAVSGEIGRGTMEMILAQPVRRLSVLAVQACVTLAGAAVLCLAILGGTAIGLATVSLVDPVHWRQFLPGAINVFAMIFFLAGASTMVSSWDSYRWRTIGFMGAFFISQLVFKMMGQTIAWFKWLLNFTFLTACEPQKLIVESERAWTLSWQYDGVLIGLGMACYVVAALVFCNRDLPAPL